MDISERSLEAAIEHGLLQHGPDAPAAGGGVRETQSAYGDAPGGYHRRRPEDYDRALCLMPRDVVNFVLATQPREWQKLAQHHGAAVKEQFARRTATSYPARCSRTSTWSPTASSRLEAAASRKWKGMEASAERDFYVRSGPGSVRLTPDSAQEYIRTRFQSQALMPVGGSF